MLSIIVANYNHGNLLKRCIFSILERAPSDGFEILIVDDKSTDNSLQEIHSLAVHKSVRHACREINGGVEEAVNTGVALAKGEYLHLFAADDLYLPGALQTMMQLIKAHPHVSIFCSDYATFQEKDPGKVFSKSFLRKQQRSTFRFFTPSQTFSLFRRTDFWLPGHTVFVKKSALHPYLPQDKKLGSISDWYMYHQIALNEGVGYFSGSLIARREDPRSYSFSMCADQRRSMWHYLLSLNPPSQLIRSGILRMLGLRAIYFDLLKTPRYWKYLFPMVRRELAKKLLSLLSLL